MPTLDLDLRTLFFAMTAVELVMAGVLILFWHNQRSFPGVGWIAGASILAVAGSLFIAFRPVMPVAVSVLGNNLCFQAAIMLYVGGVQHVRGAPCRPVFGAAMILLNAVSISYFTFIDFDTAARIVIASLSFAAAMFVGAFDLMAEMRSHLTMACRTVATLLGVHGLYLVVNAGTTALVGANPDFLATDNAVRLLAPFFGIGAAIGWGLGFLWIAHDILRARLRQAEKLEAVGRLAGGIAHELNNMLFPIVGMSTIVKEQLPPGTEESKRLGTVIQAAQRAADLIRRILVFGRQDWVVAKEIDVASAVRDAVESLRGSAPAGVEIAVTIDDRTGHILADEGHIQTLVLNLASNAMDAMEGRSGRLLVELSPVAVGAALAASVEGLRQGHYARLRVIDHGRGMDEATLDRAFDPFFTTKEVGEGTGLGLSMVDGIVSLIGGAVTLTSEPGVGTTAAVYLPLTGS